MPDVIERRECPECGQLGKCPRHAPPGELFVLPVTRRYVAVDALLRDDVVEAAARETLTWASDVRSILSIAVKRLTGGEA